MSLLGLSRDDSHLIGFVISCIYNSAITKPEMRQWGLHMIDKYDVEELPLYMFDLIDFTDALCKIDQLIGFSSHWAHTEADNLALSGIAIARGFTLFEEPATPLKLLKKIRERPWLFKRFKETFPFIDMSEAEKKIYGEFRGQYIDFGKNAG